MVRLPDFNPIEFLVARKFPDVLAVLSGAGPPSLRPRATPSPKYREKRRQEIADYKATLRAMPPDALQALLESETKKSDEEERATIDPEEKARFYNQPYADADFNHWSRAAHWTLDEAVALSLGKNPEVVNWKALEPYQFTSRFVIQYARLRDLAQRALPWNQLFDPVHPGIFIGWAHRNEIPFPQELEDAVQRRGNHIINWKAAYDELKKLYDVVVADLEKTRKNDIDAIRLVGAQRDEALARLHEIEASKPGAPLLTPDQNLSTREKESLLKLVIGMAVGGYAFNPNAKRSDQTAEIASDLAKAGVPLDADTVRKWLRTASEILPQSQTE
jgi:hypothetical protein